MSEYQAIYGNPGAGKTTTLLRLCDEHREANERVCLLSYTRAAAAEIKSRLNNDPADDGISAHTIHSMVFNIMGLHRTQVVTQERLAQFGEDIGIPISGAFDITGEKERVISEGDEAMGIIGRANARMVDPEDEYTESTRPLAMPTFTYMNKAYRKWKTAFGYMDFTDMLMTYVRNPLPISYEALIIDEAQDMSPAQWAVVRAVSKFVKYIKIAGDPDQALYSFIGAHPEGMKEFVKEYGAIRQSLSQSYRIPATVHALAMQLRARMTVSDSTDYAPRDEVGQVNRYPSMEGLDFDDTDTLILYRTHALRQEIERTLLDKYVPYKVLSGMPAPWDSKFGKCVKAFRAAQDGKVLFVAQKKLLDKMCRVSNITENTKWYNVLNIPDRYIDYMVRTEDQEPCVRLATIHGAKGMEADRVVLLTAMTERVIDGFTTNPDVEHKVFYVGATRAKNTLDIVTGDRGYPL